MQVFSFDKGKPCEKAKIPQVSTQVKNLPRIWPQVSARPAGFVYENLPRIWPQDEYGALRKLKAAVKAKMWKHNFSWTKHDALNNSKQTQKHAVFHMWKAAGGKNSQRAEKQSFMLMPWRVISRLFAVCGDFIRAYSEVSER